MPDRLDDWFLKQVKSAGVVFLIIALIAGLFGVSVIASISHPIARTSLTLIMSAIAGLMYDSLMH